MKSLFIASMGYILSSEVYAAPQYTIHEIHDKKCYLSAESGLFVPSFHVMGSYRQAYYGGASIKVGVPFGAEIGYKLSNQFRIGLNLSYRSHNIDQTTQLYGLNSVGGVSGEEARIDQKLDSMLFMMNVRYSIGDFDGMTPYIMAGIGMNDAANGIRTERIPYGGVLVTTKYIGIDEIKFAWNIGIGIEKALGQNIKLSLGYSLTDLGKRSMSDTEYVYCGTTMCNIAHHETFTVISLKAHAITLGFIYSF